MTQAPRLARGFTRGRHYINRKRVDYYEILGAVGANVAD